MASFFKRVGIALGSGEVSLMALGRVPAGLKQVALLPKARHELIGANGSAKMRCVEFGKQFASGHYKLRRAATTTGREILDGYEAEARCADEDDPQRMRSWIARPEIDVAEPDTAILVSRLIATRGDSELDVLEASHNILSIWAQHA
jgi:hypothetical protein